MAEFLARHSLYKLCSRTRSSPRPAMLYMLRELNQIIALREKVTNKYCRTVSTCRLQTTKSGDTLTSRIFAPFVSVQRKIIIQIDWIIQWIIGSESAFISSPQLDRFDEIVANIPSRLGEFLPTRASHHARVYNIWLSESNQVNNYIVVESTLFFVSKV